MPNANINEPHSQPAAFTFPIEPGVVPQTRKEAYQLQPDGVTTPLPADSLHGPHYPAGRRNQEERAGNGEELYG